ncbi:MAG: amidohydrolase family protein [Kiloniellaceae bacterium]
MGQPIPARERPRGAVRAGLGWIAPRLAAVGLIAVASWRPGAAAERLPVFDTHVHYGREAWAPYGPAAIFAKLDAAFVPRALVSSTPDDGTLMLHEHDPQRIVPILRPYRDLADMGGWFRDEQVLEYVVRRLERGIYRGIGEFHLRDEGAAATPQMRRLVRLAMDRGIVLHVHSGAGPVRALFALEPDLKILWAHAGMSEPPEVVGALLDRHPRLWTEVSFRAGDIAPGGRLDPAWRDLFLRHPDRFMIGTDTYVTRRWEVYGALVEEHRRWLAQLPRAVATAIAYGNAAREFGAGKPEISPD